MNEYNFLADLLHTFQSLNDWIKVLVLLIPPGFALCVVGLCLRHKATMRAIAVGRVDEYIPSAQDAFDRVDYLRNTAIPYEDGEEILAEPLVTLRHRT